MMRGRLETRTCGLLAALLAAACTADGTGEKRRDEALPFEVHAAEASEVSADPEEAPEADSASPHLPGPSLTEWQPILRPSSVGPGAYDGYSHVLVVTDLEVDLYGTPGDRWGIGLARLGTRLPARPTSGKGCSGGTWYQVTGGAHVCSNDGVHVAEYPLRDEVLGEADRARRPDVGAPNPFLYAKAKVGAPELARLPEADELDELAARRSVGGLVNRWLDGTYLMALSRKVESGGHTYYRTIEGRYLRESDIEAWKGKSTMHGEHLGDGVELPLAFALDDTDLYCVDGGAAKACGAADKHARFEVADTVEIDGETLVVSDEGTAMRRDAVRVADRVDRPKGVSASEKWMHIDLSEQTLVAYEGDTPVFATLVSSGKPSHATPSGLWRVDRKYLTKTMRGKDSAGPYEVQEVPWTMYYDGNYAVHGAYWHDVFGRTRSHGCTNVPPVDARWLYLWSEPELPAGWHAMFHRHGAHIYITGQTPPDDA